MHRFFVFSLLFVFQLYATDFQTRLALTFDDLLLQPAHSEILPKDVNIRTKLTDSIELNIPLSSAAMDTVTEWRLAVALAEEGGIGIIHKNLSLEEQVDHVTKVKKFESGVIKDPIVVSPHTTIRELLAITTAHNISGVPVVVGDELVGIVTNRDVRFEKELDQPVSNVMTPKDLLVTVKEGANHDDVIALLHKNRIERVLIVNDQFHLRGMITMRDILRAYDKPNACKDAQGRLRVGAAVGANEHDHERVAALLQAGVDVIVVDTSHGHSQRVLEMVKWIKTTYPDAQVIAGNIATADAALALVQAGADAVKVGIGPGSICTTRIVTGVGVPQMTALTDVVQALKGTGIPIIADGGIRYSGDICKALAAGADVVMIGSLFAGTQEAPGEVELYQGRAYKSYRGMGAVGAMAKGSRDRYFQDSYGVAKLVPEGIEGRVAYKGPLETVVYQLTGGLRSCMGYLGAATIAELHHKAQFVRITNAGLRESHVHDVNITKEAPNYWVS